MKPNHQPILQRKAVLRSSGVPALPAKGRLGDIVGAHPLMVKVFEQIKLWAPTSANIVIAGETGVGKELVAQALHGISARSSKPFVVLDCSTLSKELLESELFGHEKGAFTGAVSLHLGRFERANGGTLFIDEIANMSAEVQAKLLRVLQNRTFERIGGNREIRVDVRIVAASNRPLRECVAEGKFREDLYHRLNTGVIEIPP
ncbi:MAG TPA: sigma-54 factor interaction domain-containing protein, partial [candidate division Zixibacteria bacterium]|nr:sigma-54 factor interaction domain-containing protein [candidate division Zixibacteria bacterium]